MLTENAELIHKKDDAETAKSNLEKENAALKADMESLKFQLHTKTWLNDVLKRENEGLHVKNKVPRLSDEVKKSKEQPFTPPEQPDGEPGTPPAQHKAAPAGAPPTQGPTAAPRPKAPPTSGPADTESEHAEGEISQCEILTLEGP